ncbi:phosphotransferase [Pleionea litopenaei]|uniref:Phosphotransferase n=1 Tax=Pleionea litopenaei TaxID=3070815 RepID=A0AA51X5C1_9GAMM|nr:phosphotransferase [Pleionea sp. HL-JVS1]WMS85584.1 phosphotransferase [Pleionea sp. HL-JVS1]
MNPCPLAPLIERGFLSQQARLIKQFPSASNQCYLITDIAISQKINECVAATSEESLKEQGQQAPKASDGLFYWVLKIFRTDRLSFDFQSLLKLNASIAAQQLTPPIVRSDASHRCVLMPYRSAGTIAQSSISDTEKLYSLAQALVRAHQSDLSFSSIDLTQEIEWYANQLNPNHPLLSERLGLPELPKSAMENLVPCHMDPSWENLLINGEWLDWEYARQAPALFDIAAAATINRLTETQVKILFNYYSDRTKIEGNFEGTFDDIQKLILWSDWLNRAWFELAS